MKTAIFFSLFMVSLFVNGQTKKTIEFSGTFNSVDRIQPLGNMANADNKILDGGDYSNNSLAVGLTGKYFFADNLAIRLRSIYTKRKIHDYRDISTGAHTIYDIHVDQQIFKIAPGIQWSALLKKFSFFGGLDLPLSVQGKMIQKTYNLDESLTGTNRRVTNITYTIPGGYSIGLGFFAGSNYYVVRKLAIGFEMGTAYQYTSIGGTLQNHSVTTGTINSESYSEHNETIKEMRFAVFQASINLTVKL